MLREIVMKIAGFQKVSLIDYPEKIAAVVFTPGCNFRCPFCHNSELVLFNIPTNSHPRGGNSVQKVKLIPEAEVFAYLKKRQGLLDAVVITGGEPTLQKDLIDFIKKVKKLGYLVKLDTNGSNPELINRLITNQLIDYVAMDIKTSLDKYSKCAKNKTLIDNVLQSINILKSIRAHSRATDSCSLVSYEFRTTVVPGLLEKDDFEKIGTLLQGSKNYSIQQFRNKKTLTNSWTRVKPYSPAELKEFTEIMKKYVKNVMIKNI